MVEIPKTYKYHQEEVNGKMAECTNTIGLLPKPPRRIKCYPLIFQERKIIIGGSLSMREPRGQTHIQKVKLIQTTCREDNLEKGDLRRLREILKKVKYVRSIDLSLLKKLPEGEYSGYSLFLVKQVRRAPRISLADSGASPLPVEKWARYLLSEHIEYHFEGPTEAPITKNQKHFGIHLKYLLPNLRSLTLDACLDEEDIEMYRTVNFRRAFPQLRRLALNGDFSHLVTFEAQNSSAIKHLQLTVHDYMTLKPSWWSSHCPRLCSFALTLPQFNSVQDFCILQNRWRFVFSGLTHLKLVVGAWDHQTLQTILTTFQHCRLRTLSLRVDWLNLGIWPKLCGRLAKFISGFEDLEQLELSVQSSLAFCPIGKRQQQLELYEQSFSRKQLANISFSIGRFSQAILPQDRDFYAIFSRFIMTQRNLRTIDINHHQVTVGVGSLTSLIQQLRETSPSLENLKLDFWFDGHSTTEFNHLCESLSQLGSLRVLGLPQLRIKTASELAWLVRHLHKIPRIHSVSFGSCANLTEPQTFRDLVLPFVRKRLLHEFRVQVPADFEGVIGLEEVYPINPTFTPSLLEHRYMRYEEGR